MTIKRPLKALYQAVRVTAEGEYARKFLQDILRVPNLSHVHIIEELQAMNGRQPESRKVVALYRLLEEFYQAEKGIMNSIRYFVQSPSLHIFPHG